MKKFGALVVVVLVVGASVYWLRSRTSPQVVGIVGGGGVGFAPGMSATVSGGIVGGGSISVKTEPASNANNAPPVDPEFQKWLAQAARSVDSPKVASRQVSEEMARVAATLTPAQASQLLQTALNDAAPAGEKILSVYLLGEGGPRSRAQLAALIQNPLPDRGALTADSPAATLNAADKARLVMAVEALAAQAKTDPSALQALVTAIAAIQDPNVKRLAQKYLDEIRGH